MLIFFLVSAALLIAAGKISLHHVVKFLVVHRMTANNFRNQRIPTGFGVYLWFLLMVYFFLFDWVYEAGTWVHTYILAMTVVFFLGWLDDSLGNPWVKGIRGHLQKWKNERVITTGLLKAAGISIVGLWVIVKLGNSPWVGFLQFFVLILMTNAMNLLDLRPGRALKGFFLLTAAFLVCSPFLPSVMYLLPIMIGAVLIFPRDLGARIMLGDTGANFIGFALGFCVVLLAPWWFQLVMLALMLLMHWVAERSSITELIDRNRLLRWLDQAGRI